MADYSEKLKNLEKANKRLREAVTEYKALPDNSLYRDGLIQRFEFTIELTWKTTAEYLRSHGVALNMVSPKTVFKSAYSLGIIDNEELWVKLLDDRNITSHIYDEEEADKIANEICLRYSKELAKLYKTLSVD